MNILLGLTGSVASVKLPELATKLSILGELKIVATPAAERFFRPDTQVKVYTDRDEWNWNRGDPILHIDLKNWMDVLVIAPLSANSLAKLAYGFSDNLLTTICRAMDENRVHMVVAPAMNTAMWDKPITRDHLAKLQANFPKLKIVQPIAKKLACGEIGVGAMAKVDSICRAVQDCYLEDISDGW